MPATARWPSRVPLLGAPDPQGDYSNFEEKRAEESMMRDKAIDNQEKQLAHMQAFVDRFRASAARASMAQSRLKAMSKIERLAPTAVDPSIVFNFPDPDPIGTVNVIQLIDVAFGYDTVRRVDRLGSMSGGALDDRDGPESCGAPALTSVPIAPCSLGAATWTDQAAALQQRRHDHLRQQPNLPGGAERYGRCTVQAPYSWRRPLPTLRPCLRWRDR